MADSHGSADQQSTVGGDAAEGSAAGTAQDRTRQDRVSLVHRARLVGLLTLASRVLGLVRDGCMASHFGQGPILDAFTVAFRIPNMARQLFGEGALSTAFLPVFLRDMERNGKQTAFQTATGMLLCLAVGLTGFVVVVELIVLALRGTLSPGYEADLLLSLVGLLAPYLMLVCVLAQACAVMHGLGGFTMPGLFPVMLNVFWIASIFLSGIWFTEARDQITCVAWSVVGTGILQVAMCVPVLRRMGFRFEWDWDTAQTRLAAVLRTVLPVLAGLSIMQLNSTFDSLLAWALTAPAEKLAAGIEPPWYQPLDAGAASALYLGQRMYQFPLGVFAVALGTVIFPLLTTHAERGERDLFKDDLVRGLRLVIGIGIPAAAGLFVIALPMTKLLFERGRFDAADSAQTAAVIGMYAVGVWAACVILIINRAFYALGDRMTPLRIGMCMVGVNVVLNTTLVWFLRERGLALGTSLSVILQTILIGRVLLTRVEGLQVAPILDGLVRTVIATAAMSIVAIVTLNSLAPDGLATGMIPAGLKSVPIAMKSLRLLLPVATGTCTYFMACRILHFHEPLELLIRHPRS